ncbi:C40 family peptidase [Pseudomonas sp.]|jgi:cell wall-associated NlpC family hydrolase|uniref:C40 family peptidase n=1 Tax=Pseudomonas sp. TaxID=306 RepID=UPI002EDACF5B
MSFTVRLIVASLAVLLAACSSTPPPAPRKLVYRPVVSAPPQFPSPLADDILLRAIGLVGTPYRWGGNTPDSGFDCSGLIGYVYHDAAGITLPRSTREMITLRGPDIDRSQLQTGDLVFFATGGGSHVSHAGIYVGEGRFVHAPATGGTVKLDSLDKPYWQKAWLNAKRVIQPSNLAKQ